MSPAASNATQEFEAWSMLAGLVLLLLAAAAGAGDSAAAESETGASVKAHMADGSVVLFPDGLRIEREGTQTVIRGNGRSLAAPGVFALEYYNERLMDGALRRTAARNSGVPVDARQSSASLYTFDGSGFVLEGEAFSTNILAAAEADDLDRLDAGVAVDGTYRLRIGNHAWETQYLNSLRLKAVDHPPAFEVLPTRERDLVVVGALAAPSRVTSKDGRDVSALLARRDGEHYRTSPEVIDELTRGISRDWIEFEVEPPPDVRELYVAMRVRNTLFSNVLLDDALLTGRGAETIDLLGGERFRLLEMWRLYRWVRKYMGLRVLVGRGERFHVADRIGGTGPSAWRQVVAKVRVRSSGKTRVRLAFLADSWLIDWVAVSFEGDDRVRPITLPLSELSTAGGTPVSPEPLTSNDKRYLNLYPGEVVEAAFSVGPTPPDKRRTYFVETQGYFIKWLGPAQITGFSGSFRPRQEDLFRAARRWLDQREALESTFAPAATSRL